ncbi:hypothetical protein L596_027595 [Steinernema carpocapsae]|uniref:HTH psq-type domain-containing protein n=1 Tax=Steinernema carpocapsae TaxID=34508 RepID=A0A4V5ZXT9_STECR|nr:hypothetical protein L596_027595 [Steinernema carpocapsae]
MCENKRTLRGFQPAAFDPSFDSFASSFPISSRSLLVSSQRSSCLLSAKPESGNSKRPKETATLRLLLADLDPLDFQSAAYRLSPLSPLSKAKAHLCGWRPKKPSATMAALCGLRCSNERRSNCREMQRWNRNMLLAVGLETVFQRFSKDSDSSDAAEARVSPDYARDWKQSEVCEVCKCRRTSAGPATEEVTEKPQKSSFNISDLTKSKNSFTASSPPSKLDFDPFNPFLKGFGAPSAANAFPANAWTPTMFGMIPNPMIQSLHSYFGLEYHPPAFPLPFPPQWPSQSTLNGMLAAAISDKKKQQQEKAMKNSEAAKAKEVLKMETNGNAMEDQPLDLSAKTGIKIVVEDMSSDSPSESPPIASKSEPKQENVLVPPKMPLMVGTKRNYSQMDLEKAVLDIRSGRLGTRRASVVYGIPRSTLRNKIYKLEAAAELSGEPSQYKRRRAGGQTLQERLTAGESIREARKAQKAISTPENTWPTGVPPQPVETLQNGTASPEKSTFVEDLKPKAAAVAAAAGGRSGKRGEGVEQRRGFRGRRKVRRFQEDPSKTRTLQNPKIEQFMLLNVLVSNKRKASDSSLCLH